MGNFRGKIQAVFTLRPFNFELIHSLRRTIKQGWQTSRPETLNPVRPVMSLVPAPRCPGSLPLLSKGQTLEINLALRSFFYTFYPLAIVRLVVNYSFKK